MPQIGVKKKIKQHAKGERPNKRRVKLIVCWLSVQLDDSCKPYSKAINIYERDVYWEINN